MSTMRTLILYYFLFLAIEPSTLAAGSAPESRAGMSAHVFLVHREVAHLNDVEFVAVITNSAPTNVTFNLYTGLSAEVINLKDEVVFSTPSPLPSAAKDHPYWELRAGASTTVKDTLKGYPAKMPAGLYRLRMKSMPSNEAAFRIR